MSGLRQSVLLALGFLISGSTAVPIQGQTASIRVVIVAGANDTPVPGATLALAVPGQSLRVATSDASGGAYVTSSAGAGVLSVSADGFAPFHLRWPPRSASNEVRVRLDLAAELRVLTTSRRTGQFVPASVGVVLNRAGNPGSYSARGAQGVADLSGLPQGSGMLIVKAEGFAPAVISIDLRPGMNTEAVALAEAARVSGFVVGADGQPVAGATVSVDYGLADNPSRILAQLVGGRLRTGSDGAFLVVGIVPNRLARLRATLRSTRSESVAIGPLAGQAVDGLVLRLSTR